MRWLRAGALYFLLVFGAGFVLGTIRQLLVVPHLGAMWAELLEMPLMFVVIVTAARWVARRSSVPPTVAARAAMGLAALALLVTAELSLVLSLRGVSLAEYIANREPVSGAVYLIMLLVFAAMPWLLTQLPRRAGSRYDVGQHE